MLSRSGGLGYRFVRSFPITSGWRGWFRLDQFGIAVELEEQIRLGTEATGNAPLDADDDHTDTSALEDAHQGDEIGVVGHQNNRIGEVPNINGRFEDLSIHVSGPTNDLAGIIIPNGFLALTNRDVPGGIHAVEKADDAVAALILGDAVE